MSRRNSNSILLSEKHGVNPSIMQCYLCLEEFGLALVGRMKGDVQAPRVHSTPNYVCDTCQGYMKQGILLICVPDDKPDHRLGRLAVITEEATKRIFPEPQLSLTLKTRCSLISESLWKMLELPMENIDYSEDEQK